jgi:hypothetical protein
MPIAASIPGRRNFSMSTCPYCGGDHSAGNDGSYIIGPIGTPGSQVTVQKPGGGNEQGIVGGDGTVHVGDKTYQTSRN